MRILKFESQLTIALFAAVNHLNGPLRKQNFTLTGSKGHGFWFVIGGFRSILCVSVVFQGLLLVIVTMIDGSKKCNREGGFWTLEFACLWKVQQNRSIYYMLLIKINHWSKTSVGRCDNQLWKMIAQLLWKTKKNQQQQEIMLTIRKSKLWCTIWNGIYEITCGLVHASYSLPKWQAVKLTFFAP